MPLDTLCAFWCRIPSRPNFGDALTPWLIKRMTGRYPIFTPPKDRRQKYFVTGSILGLAADRCTVWGAGIMNRDDAISPKARLLAVRGPLSRMRALACDVTCPEVFGDPALLLPRLYTPARLQQSPLGIVAHFSDRPRLTPPRDNGVALIDIQAPIEQVIDQIASCEKIISSSLHGLIAAHAYGVPAAWGRWRPLPSGDDSKFHDYFLSIGYEEQVPIVLRNDLRDVGRLAEQVSKIKIDIDLEPLWQSCPFGEA